MNVRLPRYGSPFLQSSAAVSSLEHPNGEHKRQDRIVGVTLEACCFQKGCRCSQHFAYAVFHCLEKENSVSCFLIVDRGSRIPSRETADTRRHTITVLLATVEKHRGWRQTAISPKHSVEAGLPSFCVCFSWTRSDLVCVVMTMTAVATDPFPSRHSQNVPPIHEVGLETDSTHSP